MIACDKYTYVNGNALPIRSELYVPEVEQYYCVTTSTHDIVTTCLIMQIALLYVRISLKMTGERCLSVE